MLMLMLMLMSECRMRFLSEQDPRFPLQHTFNHSPSALYPSNPSSLLILPNIDFHFAPLALTSAL